MTRSRSIVLAAVGLIFLCCAAANAEEQGLETVAGRLARAATKSRSGATLEVLTLAGRPVLVANSASLGWTLVKKHDLGETTVVLLDQRIDAGTSHCGIQYWVLAVSRSGAIRASNSFGECSNPESRVEGQRVVFEFPDGMNKFQTNVWIFENGEVREAGNRQAPELAAAGALQSIAPSPETRHRMVGEVRKSGADSLQLKLQRPVRIEGEFCGPYVTDEIAIYSNPPPPAGATGTFEVVLDCPRAGPMVTAIRPAGPETATTTAAVALLEPFREGEHPTVRAGCSISLGFDEKTGTQKFYFDLQKTGAVKLQGRVVPLLLTKDVRGQSAKRTLSFSSQDRLTAVVVDLTYGRGRGESQQVSGIVSVGLGGKQFQETLKGESGC